MGTREALCYPLLVRARRRRARVVVLLAPRGALLSSPALSSFGARARVFCVCARCEGLFCRVAPSISFTSKGLPPGRPGVGGGGGGQSLRYNSPTRLRSEQHRSSKPVTDFRALKGAQESLFSFSSFSQQQRSTRHQHQRQQQHHHHCRRAGGRTLKMVVQHHRGEGGLKAKGQCEFLT